MGHYRMIVLANAKEGREEEYNDWYTNQHLGDVVAVPGVVSGQRFQSIGKGGHKFLAIYELETEDPRAVLKEIGARMGTDAMPTTESGERETMILGTFEPITDKLTK